ncbi:MAG: Hsp70 family protein [Alphaproteobacteria bacterium]
MYLGIDLGTSNSVIAGIVDGEVKVFRPVDGGDVLPSVIYFDKRGLRLYGRRAYDQAMLQPDAVAMGFKRLMGTSTPIQIPALGLTLTPEECTAEILRQLLGQAATETGNEQIHGAVVTIPAAFNQLQREATMRAATLAGLSNVTLLQEPVAAAMSALGTQRRSGQYLIYDLGGGTFDLALVDAVEGRINVVAHQGINMLGGRDFDRMLVNEIVRPWLITNFDMPDNFQRDPQYHRLIRIAHLAAEKAKIDLSTLEQATIFASDDEVRLVDNSGTDIFIEVTVTRKQYEDLIREPIMQTIDLARQVMEENNYKHEDIDKLIFIGGPSRTPLIRAMVATELGVQTDLKVDPLTSVAIGAVHYATVHDWGGLAPQPGIIKSDKPEAASDHEEAAADDVEDEDDNRGTTKVTASASPSPEENRKPSPIVAAKSAETPPVELDYTTPTADQEVTVYLHAIGNLGEVASLQVEAADGWASDFVEIKADAEVVVPVRKLGANDYNVRYYDARDRLLDMYEQKFTVTRSDTPMPKIRATHSIAVKALDHLRGQSNVLVSIIEKGATLPVRGKMQFRSARELVAGSSAYVSFELFQVEYPERIELNLCVGVFRIAGSDLPARYTVKAGDDIVFNWKMLESGILQATVTLPQADGKVAIELHAPRFYSPQAGEMSFDAEKGGQFAGAVLRQAEEEWGDLMAALGPEAGKELDVLRLRISDQKEILQEAGQDSELIRKVSEESRLVRQDIARFGKKYRSQMMQRQLGKLVAIFNRLARGQAEKIEVERFEGFADKVQKIIDDGAPEAFADADRFFAEMRDIFFAAAWRDDTYVTMWFDRLQKELYLFPDQVEFNRLIQDGNVKRSAKDLKALRKIVAQLLDARIAITASDATTELATISKT